MNVWKMGLLLVSLSALMVGVGSLVGGARGATFALGFAFLMNFVAYWFSDKIVLAMYRAKPLSEEEAPEVYRLVRELALGSWMPMPKLYRLPSQTPNAFATGRNPQHAVVAVTSGLLKVLDEEELKGVLAHELSHVKNRDTLVMTVAAAIAGAIMWLADMARWNLWFGGAGSRRGNRGTAALQVIVLLLVVILAPLAAMLIQLAISRTREYGADETGARLAGGPFGLASALEKLDRTSRVHPLPDANPATAHLFIVNPLSAGAVARLFSTHPPVEERIQRLREVGLARVRSDTPHIPRGR